MKGWWSVRYGDAFAWLKVPSQTVAVQRSLDLAPLGELAGRHHCSHDHPCVLPGTSAPRSTSSRSVTLTVLPFCFTSHQ